MSLSKLYSVEFYALLVERLSPRGTLVTQAGSPFFAREAFWSVVQTWEDTRNPAVRDEPLTVVPYHAYVPSFGEWGFALVSPFEQTPRALTFPSDLRYLTADIWQKSQVFAQDTARVEVEVNSIRTHALVGYYQAGWDAWFR